jgi:hypothetical protein
LLAEVQRAATETGGKPVLADLAHRMVTHFAPQTRYALDWLRRCKRKPRDRARALWCAVRDDYRHADGADVRPAKWKLPLRVLWADVMPSPGLVDALELSPDADHRAHAEAFRWLQGVEAHDAARDAFRRALVPLTISAPPRKSKQSTDVDTLSDVPASIRVLCKARGITNPIAVRAVAARLGVSP